MPFKRDMCFALINIVHLRRRVPGEKIFHRLRWEQGVARGQKVDLHRHCSIIKKINQITERLSIF